MIEGVCHHLIKDRMDLTGARWKTTRTVAFPKKAIFGNRMSPAFSSLDNAYIPREVSGALTVSRVRAVFWRAPLARTDLVRATTGMCAFGAASATRWRSESKSGEGSCSDCRALSASSCEDGQFGDLTFKPICAGGGDLCAPCPQFTKSQQVGEIPESGVR